MTHLLFQLLRACASLPHVLQESSVSEGHELRVLMGTGSTSFLRVSGLTSLFSQRAVLQAWLGELSS